MTLEQKADIEILVRLLKEEHINECEFMSLLEYIVEPKPGITWIRPLENADKQLLSNIPDGK